MLNVIYSRLKSFFWIILLISSFFILSSCKKAPVYNLGEIISFKKDGNSLKYQVEGWYPAEDAFTWIEGTNGKLALNLNNYKNGALVLKAVVYPFVIEGKLNQILEIYVNKKFVKKWTLDKASPTVLESEITPEFLNDNDLEIMILAPNAKNPKEISGSTDGRILGVSFINLSIDLKK